MPAYVIVEVETHDASTMAKYRELSGPSVSASGGRFVARGGAITPLEGGWEPQRIVIIEFESVDAAKAWWASAEYAEAKALRQAAGTTRMLIVEGLTAGS